MWLSPPRGEHSLKGVPTGVKRDVGVVALGESISLSEAAAMARSRPVYNGPSLSGLRGNWVDRTARQRTGSYSKDRGQRLAEAPRVRIPSSALTISLLGEREAASKATTRPHHCHRQGFLMAQSLPPRRCAALRAQAERSCTDTAGRVRDENRGVALRPSPRRAAVGE